ncbi:CocE/NonD family hydrolase [Amycolatopsis suaedae]|uniref:Xaa-Pro dipeptidyl-peptidase n=1 Tax=Amycolatopsis suaedae TaxID=2510978 RepID=A0A4Q7J7D5_9PSEU|nr:CocE/NonD family hydrolase [Amycolatopsis suaedae]RZQ62263.1 Xaa-Pro dipeptidyl-peptidase [Amycolatopsis suaedae]
MINGALRAVSTGMGAVVVLGLAPGVAAASPVPYQLNGGMTAPIYSYSDAIRESVWVPIGRDDDRDGRTDRVAVDIVRPHEPSTRSQKIPIIMDTSGYYGNLGRGRESQLKTYDSHGNMLLSPLYYDNYFVPRGYAVAQVDMAGTNRSTGCNDNNGPNNTASSTAVIDWLNGRTKGYASVDGDIERTAEWSSGAVGMIGKSWDGAAAIRAAGSGVEGLKTVVPIAAVSSQYTWTYENTGAHQPRKRTPYEYARDFSSPAQLPKCREFLADLKRRIEPPGYVSGDYSPGWAEQDANPTAKNVRASVFIVHGQADWNVTPLHYGTWFDQLPADVPKKMWLSQAGHVDPFDFRRAEWVTTLNRWFDRYLYDIDNGIDNEPALSVEQAPDRWADYAAIRDPRVQTRILSPTLSETPGIGGLGENSAPQESVTIEAASGSGLVGLAKPGPETELKNENGQLNRLVYATGKLTSDLRVSGTPSVTVTVRPSKDIAKEDAAPVSAYLVDYGPATIRTGPTNAGGINELGSSTTTSCWGAYTSYDTGCFEDATATSQDTDATVFSGGHGDLRHANDRTKGGTVKAGETYTVNIPLYTVDHIVPAGHRLGIVIAGSDDDVPGGAGRYTVSLGQTSLRVPIVGGQVNAEAPANTAVVARVAQRDGVQPRQLLDLPVAR